MNDTNVILEVKNLKKTFGDHVVLKDINTTITKGVCALIKGMKAKEVIARLKGITCGNKPTSCPDQLATALQEMGY